jgi:hypothetical protein
MKKEGVWLTAIHLHPSANPLPCEMRVHHSSKPCLMPNNACHDHMKDITNPAALRALSEHIWNIPRQVFPIIYIVLCLLHILSNGISKSSSFLPMLEGSSKNTLLPGHRSATCRARLANYWKRISIVISNWLRSSVKPNWFESRWK